MAKHLAWILLIFLVSCIEPQQITTSYIKNDLVKHIPDKETQVRIFPIYGSVYSTTKYVSTLELCAVKYEGNKILVIGSDRAVINKNEDATLIKRHFKQLSVAECESLLKEYNAFINKDAVKLRMNEQIQIDYTVQDGVVLTMVGINGFSNEFHLWIDGRDHPINESQFINSIKKFLKY